MRKRFEGDPLEALRGVDPLVPGDLPPDTSGHHARALFEEITTMDTMERTHTENAAPQRRPRFALALGSVAVVVAAVVGVTLAIGGDGEPDTIAGGVPIASAAMCVEQYDLATLANRDIAFDGTVNAIDGDSVTFDVNTWFAGGSEDRVTLETSAGMVDGAITSVSGDGATLDVGSRYLVSGSGGFVWACGFTMTYDSGIAGQWAQVFAG